MVIFKKIEKFYTMKSLIILVLAMAAIATMVDSQDDDSGQSFGIIYPSSTDSSYSSKSSRLASIIDGKLNKTSSSSNFKPIQTNNTSTDPSTTTDPPTTDTSTSGPVEQNNTSILDQISSIMSRVGLAEGLNLSQYDLNDVENNAFLNYIITHSLELIIAQGIQATILKDTNYNISAIYNISMQDDHTTDYYVDLELETEDDFIVNITFLSSYEPDTKAWRTLYFDFAFADEINGYIIEVNWNEESGTFIITETNLTGVIEEDIKLLNSTIKQLNMSEYLFLGGYQIMETDNIAEDPIIKVLMETGAQYVASIGVNMDILVNSTFDISKVNSVYSQENTLYRFDVDIENGLRSDMRIIYEVFYNATSKEQEVQTFAFHMIRNG